MSVSNSTSTPRGHISLSEEVLPGWPGLIMQLVNGGVGRLGYLVKIVVVRYPESKKTADRENNQKKEKGTFR
jgi:hypothetical protein